MRSYASTMPPGDLDPHGDVRALLFPRSVAVVGASPRTPAPVRSALESGVPAWGVNPGRGEVLGLPCVPTLADLPERPELAVLLVSHARVEQAFGAAAEAGIRAVVLPGLGNEAGVEGLVVAQRIAARAAELGVAVLGPNCMGVAVPGGFSSWIGTVPEDFAAGRVSVVAQSGSIGEALTVLGGRVGFRCVVSSGGEMRCDAADLLALLAADEGTGAIGLFLETVRRPSAFADALALCAEAGKPVVCLKVGRSRAGARAALAHTGALVGSQRAFSALLHAHGAIEVEDFPDLVEALEVLGRRRRPQGLRTGAISESGGEGALLADHGADAGLLFDPLPAELGAALQAEFPNYLAPGNPLDAWAVDEAERVYPRSLELMIESGAFDILVAQVDLGRSRGASEQDWCAMIVRALADAVEGTDVFPAVTTVHTGDPPPSVLGFAHERDLPLLRGPRASARALAAAARWRPARPVSLDGGPAVDLGDLLTAEGALPELESALVLERYGVPVAARRRAASPDEAAGAAVELGFPVVVKVDGPAHKGSAGGVVLGVSTPEEAAAAAERLGGRVLVARQVPSGPEAFCGMTRDPDFGPVLAVGLGGVDVESASPAVSLAPLDYDRALALVAAAGFGETGVDTLATTLVALGRLALEHEDVAAVDVNPLILGAEGAVAVDALVVVDRGGAP
jgi:acetate---CoA ligase (ADP-forming)